MALNCESAFQQELAELKNINANLKALADIDDKPEDGKESVNQKLDKIIKLLEAMCVAITGVTPSYDTSDSGNPPKPSTE